MTNLVGRVEEVKEVGNVVAIAFPVEVLGR
jgi:hypothetical protein